MKDFIYQHLNSKQVKKEEIGKTVRSHSQVESFTLQRLLKWPHLLMLTDNMPRCCYFRLELSLIRAKPCSLFLYGKWAFLWHQCVEFHYFRPIQNSPVSHKQLKMQITMNTVERVRASLLLHGIGVVTNQGQWKKFPKITFNIGRWKNVSFSMSDDLLIVLELWVWV